MIFFGIFTEKTYPIEFLKKQFENSSSVPIDKPKNFWYNIIIIKKKGDLKNESLDKIC